jgi:hypothetical protein
MKNGLTNRVSTKKTKRGFAMLDRERARKDAPAALKVLRRILKEARADLSVHEYQCNRLEYALDRVDEELNEMLPPPDAKPSARLPFYDEPGNDTACEGA